jgi:hypothetical protein
MYCLIPILSPTLCKSGVNRTTKKLLSRGKSNIEKDPLDVFPYTNIIHNVCPTIVIAHLENDTCNTLVFCTIHIYSRIMLPTSTSLFDVNSKNMYCKKVQTNTVAEILLESHTLLHMGIPKVLHKVVSILGMTMSNRGMSLSLLCIFKKTWIPCESSKKRHGK